MAWQDLGAGVGGVVGQHRMQGMADELKRKRMPGGLPTPEPAGPKQLPGGLDPAVLQPAGAKRLPFGLSPDQLEPMPSGVRGGAIAAKQAAGGIPGAGGIQGAIAAKQMPGGLEDPRQKMLMVNRMFEQARGMKGDPVAESLFKGYGMRDPASTPFAEDVISGGVERDGANGFRDAMLLELLNDPQYAGLLPSQKSAPGDLRGALGAAMGGLSAGNTPPQSPLDGISPELARQMLALYGR